MADLGFVRNESARQLRMGTSRTLAYVMLDATQPVLHRRRPGHRGRRRGRRPVARALQQRQPRRARAGPPGPPARAARAGDPASPRSTPLAPWIDARRGARRAGRDRGPHPRRRPVLLGGGRRRRSAAGWPSSTCSTGATGGSRSSAVRSRSARCATGSRGRRQAWSQAGLPAEDLVELPTAALTVAEGRGAGERLAGLPVRSRPDRRVLRQRPARARACSSSASALGLAGAGATSRSSGYDDIEFAAAAAVPLTLGAPAPRGARPHARPSCCSTRRNDPDHLHQQVLFTPELVARASTAQLSLSPPARDTAPARSRCSDLPWVFGAQIAPTSRATTQEADQDRADERHALLGEQRREDVAQPADGTARGEEQQALRRGAVAGGEQLAGPHAVERLSADPGRGAPHDGEDEQHRERGVRA